MDRSAFFAALRRRNSGIFGTSLTRGQVQGAEAVLDACIKYSADLGQTAYMLATGYGETGGKMQPQRENMNYSARRIPQVFGPHRLQGIPVSQLAGNPRLLANTVYGGEWGRRNLGNTRPNDGWDFRGWGLGQWTGRRNTEKAGKQVGMDLLSNPDALNDLKTNAELLVRWMLNGGATGLKLGQFVQGSRRDYLGARAVWGGVEASKYVKYAKAFESALTEAGYTAKPAPVERPVSAPEAPAHTDTAEQDQGFWAALLSLLGIFGRGKQ